MQYSTFSFLIRYSILIIFISEIFAFNIPNAFTNPKASTTMSYWNNIYNSESVRGCQKHKKYKSSLFDPEINICKINQIQ